MQANKIEATTINMAQALLDHGHELWEQDRYDEATRVLSRLLGLQTLSPAIAERAQFLLGDMQLSQGHYSKARRHLAAALATGTDSGETHFLMGCALDWDDEPDPPRAFYHYRRAVELEPGQPLYSSAYALMRIRRKPGSRFDRDALKRLREAFNASPDDADVVHNYASGLMQMGRHAEAEIAIRRARQRWPDHPAFDQLWYEFLRDRGSLPAGTRQSFGSPRLRVVTDDEPVILKFRPEPVATFPVAEPDAAALKPEAQASGSVAKARASGSVAARNAGRPDAAARSLSTRVRLKTALATLNDEQIASLAERLKIGACADGGPLCKHVARTLLEPGRLESIFQSLSAGSRHLIQVIANGGGQAGLKELRFRIDAGTGTNGPHFARRRAANQPLDELQQLGLIYLTSQTTLRDQADVVMIPSDLRKRLGEVIAAAQ